MEASEITHSPDVTREGLAWINDTSPKYKVILIDGMALVNAIPKTEIIKTCNDIAHKSFLTSSATWLAIPLKWGWYSTCISTPLKEQTDKGEINILPCQGHYLNPEYFSEGSPLKYQDRGRTNNIFIAAKTTLTNMQRLSLYLQTLLFSLWWSKCIRAYLVT